MSPKPMLRISTILLLTLTTLAACANPAQIPVKTDSTNVDTPAEVPNSNTQQTEAVNLDVVFNQAPRQLDSSKVLAKYKNDMLAEARKIYSETQNGIWADIIAPGYDFYDLGEIKTTPYQGQRLLMVNVHIDGIMAIASIHRVAWNDSTGQLTWFSKLSSYNDSYSGFDQTVESITGAEKVLYQNIDNNFSLDKLTLPATITLPNGKGLARMEEWGRSIHLPISVASVEKQYGHESLGKVAFTDPVAGPIYFSEGPSGCLYAVSWDGAVAIYNYDNDLMTAINPATITFKDGNKITPATTYSLMTTGCGIGMSCYFLEDVKETELVEVGTSSSGAILFEAKNRQNLLANVQETGTDADLDPLAPFREKMPVSTVSLNSAYRTYGQMFEYTEAGQHGGKRMNFENFVASHPILYWKDPFGRFSAIINNDVKPPAECGKPVIYLYPEQTTKVSVRVDIDQFTVTEPAYNDGWEVIAEPSGRLTNLADGLNYPYLFWEGISKKTLPVRGGFIVEKTGVEAFLADSLAKLGLNKQERQDFTEFWLPKMQASEGRYLLISFVGTEEFNKVAPLHIEPSPDTLIRVFMYYQPLNKPFKIAPQNLSAIERKGFTVLEWGGTSSDGWQVK